MGGAHPVMEEIIRVNQRVELEAVVRGEREHYPSRIEILDDNGIVLAAPLRGGVLEPLRIGDPVKITIQHKDSLYEFETSILGRRSGHIPYLVVKWPTGLTAANRRAFFRLDVLLNMDYAILGSEQVLIEPPIPEKRGLVKNLSGCGLLAWVEDEPDLHRGSRLLVDIHLPETSGTTIARVVRKEPIPEDHRGRVAVGLQMEDISPTFQDEIIGYLFQQQRERRSKGIL
ncbi:MAG: hypothetical protein GX354_10125 [Firmicutes bacterium]|jgi:c-di-GMP-binding flagellar brake protein YcgR|nr:hypothetical protein [Bacillota bacterium]